MQFAALVDVDRALQGMMGLTLRSDLSATTQIGIRAPGDQEPGAIDATDLAPGGRQFVLARLSRCSSRI